MDVVALLAVRITLGAPGLAQPWHTALLEGMRLEVGLCDKECGIYAVGFGQ